MTPATGWQLTPEDEAEEHEYEIVDLAAPSTKSPPAVEQWHGEKFKALGGHGLAKGLLILFGSSVGAILLTAILIVWRSDTPEQAKAYSEALLPLLEALTKFGSALFAPLFAFIFGYYFSSNKQP
jgi:hypothetical protein